MSAFDFGKELLELNGNVKRLIKDVDRLMDKIEQHERRITLLEGTGDVVKAEARAAASEQIVRTYDTISDKFGQLRSEVDQVSRRIDVISQSNTQIELIKTDKKSL